jgi:hypothetical protein
MLTFNRGVIFPHYPTRWARNWLEEFKDFFEKLASPSHTVGLEPGDGILSRLSREVGTVAIPHGGLGTGFKTLT